eukprot:5196903-Lingulodinium_polyedra.AAC.1
MRERRAGARARVACGTSVKYRVCDRIVARLVGAMRNDTITRTRRRNNAAQCDAHARTAHAP